MEKLDYWIMNLIIVKIFAVLFLIPGASAQEEQCDVLKAKFALEDLNTVVDTTHKQLVGTWLSNRCETRPFLSYLLRSYTFREDGTYRLIQHYYSDNICRTPKLTITSVGLFRLAHHSAYHSDPVAGVVRPINISLVLHDFVTFKEIAENCPDFDLHKWKMHEEYLLYANDGESEGSTNTLCFKNLTLSIFDEFKLVKIQIRPVYPAISDNSIAEFYKLELLLSSTLSYNYNEEFISVQFQPPLIKWPSEHTVMAHGKYYKIKNSCSICSNLQKSDTKPPRLVIDSELPSEYILGNWISMRCEIWSQDLYVIRSFAFIDISFLFYCKEEQTFYLDPSCAIPKFSVATSSICELYTHNILDRVLKYIKLDMVLAQLTIFDRKLSEEMSKSKACDKDIWEADKSYSLGNNYSCSELNLTIPTDQYDIIKLVTNDEGSTLLDLGLVHASRSWEITENRATSHQNPLIKCRGPEEEKVSEITEDQINRFNLLLNSSYSFTFSRHIFIIIIFITRILY